MNEHNTKLIELESRIKAIEEIVEQFTDTVLGLDKTLTSVVTDVNKFLDTIDDNTNNTDDE